MGYLIILNATYNLQCMYNVKWLMQSHPISCIRYIKYLLYEKGFFDDFGANILLMLLQTRDYMFIVNNSIDKLVTAKVICWANNENRMQNFVHAFNMCNVKCLGPFDFPIFQCRHAERILHFGKLWEDRNREKKKSIKMIHVDSK